MATDRGKDALHLHEEAMQEYKKTGHVSTVLEGFGRCPNCSSQEKPGCQQCDYCGYVIEM